MVQTGATAALGWLGWDWTHARSLDAAENSIFDTVIQWRPIEPKPSGKTVVVEIDGGRREVEVRLPGKWRVTPQLAGALKVMPGVREVQLV